MQSYWRDFVLIVLAVGNHALEAERSSEPGGEVHVEVHHGVVALVLSTFNDIVVVCDTERGVVGRT